WNWGAPAFAVDAAGVRHVAVGRTGTDPGVWYGTDDGGTWSLDRVTTNPPDGGGGLAIAPDRTPAIVYAQKQQPDGAPLADPAVRVLTGTPGAWTNARVADDRGGGTHGIARDAAGHLHVAFGSSEFGRQRIVQATDATGTWVASAVTRSSSTTADRNP